MKTYVLEGVRLLIVLHVAWLVGCAEPVPRLTDATGLPPCFENSVGMRMVLVPGGSFQMGPEHPRDPDQAPRRGVTLSPFYLSAFETTKGQFRQFAEEKGIVDRHPELSPEPREGKKNWDYWNAPGEASPIYKIDWITAVAFATWLSQREGLHYRLPTEAEWEYAARAGTDTWYWWGEDPQVGMAIHGGVDFERFPYVVFPVGALPANPWGMYEILGNAPEWTQDWYHETGYAVSENQDPTGPRTGTFRVIRGGGSTWGAGGTNAYYRGVEVPGKLAGGIRLVCEPTQGFTVPPQPIPPPTTVDDQRFQQTGQTVVPRVYAIAPGVDLRLVRIPAGSFTMGSPATELGHGRLEAPLTQVRISYDFWIGQYEVTQAQYEAVVGENPSRYRGADRPVDSVTFQDARAFCTALTERERAANRLLADEVYRLPTEPEWEYACRAGSQTAFAYGDDPADFDRFGWADVLNGSHPVGLKLPNAWGIFDMHGNVGEWTWGAPWPHPGGSVEDPRRRAGARYKMDPVYWPQARVLTVRGGSWSVMPIACRSAMRMGFDSQARYTFIGFRVVCSPIAVDVSINDPDRPATP